MELTTQQFGTVQIDDEKILQMPAGMPGFANLKRFIVIEREEITPFFCYQSVDQAMLSFIIINPYLIEPNYTVDVSAGLDEIGWAGSEPADIKTYVIVNTYDGLPEKMTANLLGPLLINTKRREAVQKVFPNSPYSHKHPLFGQAE